MYQTDDIFEGARIIRRYLEDPLHVADADDLDRTLEELVQQTDNPDQTADKIMDVLARHETTTAWMHRFLETSNQERSRYQSLLGSPAAGIAGITVGSLIGRGLCPVGIFPFSWLPGVRGFLETPIYTCPHGGCRWVVRSAGDPPKQCHQNDEPMGTAQQPWCPVHDVALERFQRES
jgi:hypothetical protein